MHTPSTLRPCPRCACLVRPGETSCPHCSANDRGANDRSLPTFTATAFAVGLALTGCGDKDVGTDSTAVAAYGVPDTSAFADMDGDGFSTNDGDCDDSDETINPDAEETAGDGVDSNCDGADDT